MKLKKIKLSKINEIMDKKTSDTFFSFIYSLGILFGSRLILNVFKIFIDFPDEVSKEISFLVIWGLLLFANYLLFEYQYNTEKWFKKSVYIITLSLFIITIIKNLIEFL